MPSNQRQIIEQTNFAYSLSRKPFEKQTEKQDELKQIEGIFLKNLMNDLIRVKLKEIVKLQDIIKKDDLNYEPKRAKT